MNGNRTGPAGGGGLRALSATLVAGALYDFAFAAAMLVAPGSLAHALSLPLPGESFYLRLIGVLLVLVGAVYLVAARDPAAERPIVALAIAGRAAGFLALALSLVGRPDLRGLWIPALGDLAFALLHAATSRHLWR